MKQCNFPDGDSGSCTFSLSCDVDNVLMSLSVHNGEGGGAWHNEISWTLYEDNVIYLSGFAPYDGVLCFDESSTYKFDMHDSWVGHFFFFRSLSLSLTHSFSPCPKISLCSS